MHAYEYIHKPLCVSLEGRHEGGVGVGVLRLTAAVGLSGMMRQGLGSGCMTMDARMKVAMSGSIDDMPNKVNVLIPIVVMGRRKMTAATSRVCVTVHAEDLLERFVLSARCWTIR
jgi:hypothetical protein